MRLTPGTTLYDSLKGPPLMLHCPIAITHLGSGICSYTSLTAGAIFQVSVPATIIRSAWRGDQRKISIPKREISKREAAVPIISNAQQANPNISGKTDRDRAQSTTKSTQVTKQ